MTRAAGDAASGSPTACVGTATGCGADSVQTGPGRCTTCSNNGRSAGAAWHDGTSDDRALCVSTGSHTPGYAYPAVATAVSSPAGNAAATGCIAGFVQTAGDATAGACTACGSSGAKDAAHFAAAGTANAGWGACTLTGYTFADGTATVTGCAAGAAAGAHVPEHPNGSLSSCSWSACTGAH